MPDNRSVVVATLNDTSGDVYDQVFRKRVLSEWMHSHGRIKGVAGGTNIRQNLAHGKNTSVDWRDGKAEIPLVEQDFLKFVLFAWKHVNGGLPIYADDERMNRGKNEIIDWVEEMITNFEETMRDTVNQGWYHSGGPNRIDGLPAICSSTNVYPTADPKQQIAGLNRSLAQYAWWRAKQGAAFTDERGVTYGPYNTAEPWSLTGGADKGWLQGYMDVSIGNEHPDLILTTPDIWGKYNSSLLPQERFTNPKLADAGFQNLQYMTATVVMDEDCPAGGTFILTTDKILLRPDTICENKLIVDPRHAMENVRADRILMEWVGNMTCTRPNRQCYIENKT